MPKIVTASGQNSKPHPEIVGLLPAAGKASRIAPLPCSKELYPIGFTPPHEEHSVRPKVVCHYLLEKMRVAGTAKAYIVLREGKWDIPAYFGHGKMLDMHLAYLMMDLPFGVPYTLDQAYPFVRDAMVVFGFPDIIFQPKDAFLQLLERQAESNADVVLGIYPARQPHKMDMVDVDADGRVREIQIKPSRTHFRYTWIIAVWTSGFTHFMHDYVLAGHVAFSNNSVETTVGIDKELFIGEVLQAAIDDNIRVEAVLFSDGEYMDIGIPENVRMALHMINTFNRAS